MPSHCCIMTMKKLLISCASKYIHSALAVWYLKAACPEYDVFECTVNEDINKVFERITAQKPDILGFSCYIWNISYVKRLTEMIRESLPHAIIIYGGPEVSHSPGSFSHLADHIVVGYGERALCELTDAIETGEKPEQIIKGYLYELPPSPYNEEYMSALNGRIAYIETSRGCPFSCAFCLSGRDEKPYFFPLERAFDDIVKLAHSGAKTIKFVDRTFNANADRAYKIWEFLLNDDRLPQDICWHFEIGADLLTEKQLRLLSKAPKGRFQMEIGLQSFNDSTLKAVNRATSVDNSVYNIGVLVDNSNIHLHTDLIIGLPHEDMESFRISFNKAYALRANMLQVGFLKLLYGSRLRNDMAKYSMECDENAPYEIKKFDLMDENELSLLHRFEDIVERMHNSGRFLRTIDFLLEKTKMTPFDLFIHIAKGVNYENGCQLDHFTALIYDLFKDFGQEMRDVLVLDRLESNNTGVLPECLKIYDKALGKAKKAVDAIYPRLHNTVRGYALLYGCNSVAFCDYTHADEITGRYTAKVISLDILNN